MTVLELHHRAMDLADIGDQLARKGDPPGLPGSTAMQLAGNLKQLRLLAASSRPIEY